MIDIESARQEVGQSLDLPSFETPADLSASDRERLYDGLAEYIIEHFEKADSTQKEWAAKRIDSTLFRQPLEEFGAGDALKSFTGEFFEQGKKIVSFENKLVRNVVIGLAIGGGLYLAFKADKTRQLIKA